MYHKRQAEAQAEAESLLEGLGPRFENWAGLLPVPIDADLLPSVIPNYRPPFRLMPHGTSPRMSNTEITNLRRLARPIAPHFVLGRNRGHQGLAAAMVKIWEKSEVVKIAVKRRVQNTNNLIMSEELKQLTGGILLSRDKFFITFYRGKDFVPEGVASALAEREASVRTLQELEEKARNERSIPVEWTPYTQPSVAVIGKEKQTPKPSWMDTMDVEEQKRLKVEVVKLQRLALASQLEKKLSITYKKKRKAEAELKKVDAFSNPIDRPVDVETITEEERFMFRKLGLKMKAYLLIGRRGVFDGVVENMHLHWKHRELVKVVVKEVDMMEVQDIARTLEYESGGILVAIVATRKGQAIIMYRGKNYQRPLELRPRNLLTKRKALKRSLELQRHESLSRNIKTLEDQINNIQAELKKLNGFDGAPKSSSNEDSDDPQDLSVTSIKDLNAVSSEKAVNIPGEGKYEELTVVKDTESVPYEEESNPDDLSEKIEQLEMLVRSGPIYRAKPLSNLERLQLRKEALSSGKAPPFFVGQNNGLEGLARGIRIYFLHNHLAKVVVKGRSKDMSMEALIHELEELTGGVFVANEGAKIIMYRGWPAGHKIPHVESLKNITPELLRALEIEEFWEGYMEKSSMFEAETGETDSDFEEANEWTSAVLPGGNDENESEQMAIWEDINEGSDEDSSWEEDDDHDSESRNYNPGQLDMHHDSEEIYGTDNEDEVGINTDEDDRWDVVGDQYEDDSEEGEDDDLKSDEEYSWDVEHEWNHEEDKTTSADQSLTKEPAQSW
ncbi:hypothetical protein KP509_31G056300 [Ceratopteris richardii]|nr:hypothetical protein KP509_31G056300 [Ceratopteris richardii]KAH7289075.1 hypothetical protein KP509_31G056300 [Ceratopteris richardii]KAH7289076.1 hypothetical protein KP509_31G056300 [Ceratopteris richardii]